MPVRISLRVLHNLQTATSVSTDTRSGSSRIPAVLFTKFSDKSSIGRTFGPWTTGNLRVGIQRGPNSFVTWLSVKGPFSQPFLTSSNVMRLSSACNSILHPCFSFNCRMIPSRISRAFCQSQFASTGSFRSSSALRSKTPATPRSPVMRKPAAMSATMPRSGYEKDASIRFPRSSCWR